MSNVFKRDVVLAQEYLGFLLLNLFDLFLTGYIFRDQRRAMEQHRAVGQEANGLANWILGHFGYAGFAVYKFLLVTVVVLACEGVAHKRPRLARAVVLVGCFLYVLVVIWEVFLIITNIEGA